MIVAASDESMLISVRYFLATELIDGGDTAVIKLIAADGKEIAVMIPLRHAVGMARSLVDSDRPVPPEDMLQTEV